MAIRGTVTNIETKTGNTNGKKWTMYKYTLDNGKSYTAFQKFNVNRGDTVDISMENNKGNWRVKEIVKVASGGNENTNANKSYQANANNPDRELYIQRQSSLKVATDIVANKLDIGKIIHIADLLVEYCQNGNSEKLEERISIMLMDSLEEQDVGDVNDIDDDDLVGAL